jgi:hypothetical protein
MDIAEFEEKQYETGLLLELAGSSPKFFSSGQALEAAVGYDFAVSTGNPSIFDLLQSGIPPGILLTPSLWPAEKQPPAERLPASLVSLIVQAKRPQHLDHWRAGQNHYWLGPYFRFHLDRRQQRILESLEVAVADDAVVRYASAAFISYGMLQQHQLAHAIAEHSSFVSPGELAGHRLWSYSGPGISGFANPEGEERPSDSIETVLGTARDLASPQTFREHFHVLAQAASSALVEARQPMDPAEGEWAGLVAETLGLPTEARQALVDWATVAVAVAFTGGLWMVLGFDDE